jgi:hypothetical protein
MKKKANKEQENEGLIGEARKRGNEKKRRVRKIE